MFQYTRETATAKCEGLATHLSGSAPLASSPLMTIGGVVNHMRWVEHSWIENRFVAGPDLGPWTDESPDQEFIDGSSLDLETIIDGYRRQSQRTDAIISSHRLDDRSKTPMRSGERPTMRWVLLHLIEENARHNGHLDLLRELADGVKGD